MEGGPSSPGPARFQLALPAPGEDPSQSQVSLLPYSLHSLNQVIVDGLSVSYGAHSVLRDVSFTVGPGVRLGLIGENGSGKSTLLRAIAGREPAASGLVKHPASLGLLWQELPFTAQQTLAEVLAAASARPRRLVAEFEQASTALAEDPSLAASAAYDAALAAATAAEVWQLDARIAQTLAALGLDHVPGTRTTAQLSGGQRARLALAALLLSRPEALLLDEPTNHLDDDGAQFLVSQLASWVGPVIFASHDRAFLDEAANRLLDLDPAPAPHRGGAALPTSPTVFGGSYHDYLGHRALVRQTWETNFATEQAQLRALEHEVKIGARQVIKKTDPKGETRISKKFYADRAANVIARRTRNARVRLETLSDNQLRKPPALLEFSAPHLASASASQHDAAAAPDSLAVSNAAVADRLPPVSFALSAGEKLLITGANGTGKSTLLAAIAGQLPLSSGSISGPLANRIALLTQDTHYENPDLSVRQTYAAEVGRVTAERTPLDTFGLFHSAVLQQPVGTLSVGGRRRLAIAVVLAKPPGLLLLDEPTNHLSLALAEELEKLILRWPGTVIVASHDRWLRQRWPGSTLALGAD